MKKFSRAKEKVNKKEVCSNGASHGKERLTYKIQKNIAHKIHGGSINNSKVHVFYTNMKITIIFKLTVLSQYIVQYEL